MNWDRIEGTWKQLIGRLGEKWGHFIHSELHVAAGHRKQLIGKIQKRYGLAREDAEKHLHSCHDDPGSPSPKDIH